MHALTRSSTSSGLVLAVVGAAFSSPSSTLARPAPAVLSRCAPAALRTAPARLGVPTLPGDVNNDERVNFDDIDAFVFALILGRGTFEDLFPAWWFINADCNLDGFVDFGDIDPFVEILTR